ncbi:hypothetical protein [Scytonema sp. NUACC26]
MKTQITKQLIAGMLIIGTIGLLRSGECCTIKFSVNLGKVE